MRKGTSAKGNAYAFVKLADESTFENSTFMLQRDQVPDSLQLHTRYVVELDQQDSNGSNFFSVTLTPEKATDKQK